jgi:probable addiction module antidote protein
MVKDKYSIPFEEVLLQDLSTPQDIREFLNATLEEYLEDGDFNGFYRSLEYVIKAQDNISGFAKRSKISRTTLYDIFRGRKEPKIQTIAQILAELGYKIQVA